jgi:type I restriction enzyme S subunit
LKSALWRSYVSSIIGGSAQPGANAKQFADFEFPLPDLTTQTQIAQILTSLDDKIELNLQMNQTLEATAQALFKEWFVNFNFPNFDGELQNDLPNGWRMGSLSEIVSFVVDNRGKTPNTLIEKENNYPLIEVNSLINSRVVTQQHLAKKYVDEETYNNWFRKGHPKKGDVLFSTVGSIGEISLVFDEKFCIAQNIIALRSIFNGSFLFFTLKNLKQSLLSLDVSSVQPSIKVPHLLKSEILIPNEEIIKAYEESILPIIEKINENSIQIQTLTQTRDTLLPKLMSGKIEIKN